MFFLNQSRLYQFLGKSKATTGAHNLGIESYISSNKYIENWKLI